MTVRQLIKKYEGRHMKDNRNVAVAVIEPHRERSYTITLTHEQVVTVLCALNRRAGEEDLEREAYVTISRQLLLEGV